MKNILIALALFAAYAYVSNMDYEDEQKVRAVAEAFYE